MREGEWKAKGKNGKSKRKKKEGEKEIRTERNDGRHERYEH